MDIIDVLINELEVDDLSLSQLVSLSSRLVGIVNARVQKFAEEVDYEK